ncbi:MAG: magnesium-translocating P-type ATPase [Eubacteriaceae bacterium]|nr:magnesium-translocating P-type ATPase [Eubacteriaceae bacterium]
MNNAAINNTSLRQNTTSAVRRERNDDRLRFAALSDLETVLTEFASSLEGLSEHAVGESSRQFGENTITRGNKPSLGGRLLESFVNPFTAILFLLAIVSAFSDIIMAKPNEAEPMTLVIILAMTLISGVLRFVQETRSGNAAEKLLQMIKTTANVKRLGQKATEIPIEEIVVGDIVHLAAGDMIPADMRIIKSKDLFASQSALTGESVAVEKSHASQLDGTIGITEFCNLAFMGTTIISGSATGIAVAVGDDTIFGGISANTTQKPPQTSFEKGVNSVSWLLIKFMLAMVPMVLLIIGFGKGNWLEASLFAVSIAVGLTPEMLPMIVTTCLAKGAVAMSKEKTIIKNLNSIQNLGAMDILCTDKTGTLTQDKVVLQYHLNIHGEKDASVLGYAFLNSYYQTGLKNLIDIAIIERALELQESVPELTGIAERFQKVDEIPFDFERRRMSVVVKNGKTQMITKGAVEEMLEVCSFAEYEGSVVPLEEPVRDYILQKSNSLHEEGMRVIAVAQKTNPSPVESFGVADESGMTFLGYLAFLDPPKESTAAAILALKEHGVQVKVLTGDNDKVAANVCSQVGISAQAILLGSDLEHMDDAELGQKAGQVDIFAKLSPQQKARVITVLRENGHCVGYMGDGINDAAGMAASDVGISVDTAVDIAKESADVILLEKDLTVLEKGIVEGRKTYANMIKYIKMTASSNFGNMFSVLVASAFLPFLPMMSIHLILLNLVYDISCAAIPWDNVDGEFLKVPRKWDASNIGKFMVWIGPTSSVFDITTYLLLYFVICPAVCGGLGFSQISDPGTKALFIAIFQAGWFVESMWSQSLVIHMIRTPKIPFLQSRASLQVAASTFAGIAVLSIVPFTAFGSKIGFAPLPPAYFGWLVLTILVYMALVTVAKQAFVKRHGELL